MGELNVWPLGKLIEKYRLANFVETGTGIGTGLEYALQFPFERAVSIEIVPELHRRAVEKFGAIPNLKLINDNSRDGLFQAISFHIDHRPALFWLDAHFPGADFGLGKYDDDYEAMIKTPLQDEIGVLFCFRDCSKDVIIIDDLRMYEDGPYEAGNWPDRARYGLDISFINNVFGASHEITRDYRQQGFLVLEPVQ